MTAPAYTFAAPDPVEFQAPGGEAGQIADMLTTVIRAAADHSPRSLQRTLGPSQIGTPCDLRIGFALAGVEPVNNTSDPLPSILGTGTHSWLAGAFTEANRGLDHVEWLVEQRVDILPGIVPGGNGDLFHVPTRTVIDWKFPGETAMRKYRKDGPGPEYEIQIQTYGVGFLKRGLTPKRVAIVFIPRAGRLDGIHVWTDTFKPEIAATALQRVQAINDRVQAGGLVELLALPTADAYCSWCPWHTAGTTKLLDACPGHTARQATSGTATSAA
jgi:hypothetical protein